MVDIKKISIVGLGYVGLPLAVEFSKYFETIGFDISLTRVEELSLGKDSTNELSDIELMEAIDSHDLSFTNDMGSMEGSEIYIVTVPTPIDDQNRPDLSPLESACKSIGTVLEKGNIVIFESTVYPGATEEVCVPILEEVSGLKYNTDFSCGYSPERINPGDREHNITNILKITSASNEEAAVIVDNLYKKVVKAGTHLAASIKIAESAKIIENIQRDVNIALMNELSKLFYELDVPTEDVLAAAGTKWNFSPFKPGLVGGHCIGVDPYYLTYKAQEIGFNPNIILAGRGTNDGMSEYVSERVAQLARKEGLVCSDSSILILGITFKANCPDIRNTKVIDLITHLKEHNFKQIDVIDPLADIDECFGSYQIKVHRENQINYDDYEIIIHAVNHKDFETFKKGKNNKILFDIQSTLPGRDGGL